MVRECFPSGCQRSGLMPGWLRVKMEMTGVPKASATWTGPESFEINKRQRFNRLANWLTVV